MKNYLSITATFTAGTLLCGGLLAGIVAEPAIAEPPARTSASAFHSAILRPN
jgi:hypothetical protein